MTQFLPYNDVRLGLRAGEADPAQALTRMAIQLISKIILTEQNNDGVFSAPAFGMPVRVIGIAKGNDRHVLLNPKLMSATDYDWVIGEKTPHTGHLRRNSFRARKITLFAKDHFGQDRVLELEGQLACQTQALFEVMDSDTPFSWLTVFHHLWLAQNTPARAGRFIRLSETLFRASAPQKEDRGKPAADSMIFQDHRHVLLHDHSGAPLARLDVQNLLLPEHSYQHYLLALMNLLRIPHYILYGDLHLMPVMLAARLLYSDSLSYLWQDSAANRHNDLLQKMGLLPGVDLFYLPGTLAEFRFDAKKEENPLFDTVILDTIARQDEIPSEDHIRHIARAIFGKDGILLWASPQKDSAIERALTRCFTAVHRCKLPTGEVIYIACKTPFDLGTVQTRFSIAAMKTGLSGFNEVLVQGITPLDKAPIQTHPIHQDQEHS